MVSTKTIIWTSSNCGEKILRFAYFCKSYCQRKLGTFLWATLYVIHLRSDQCWWWSMQSLTGFLDPPYPLTNFQTQKYYENDTKIKGVYLWTNLKVTMKFWNYIINLDEFKSVETHRIALYFNSYNLKNFEHIPKEIKVFIGNEYIIRNIFRTQGL